jgi:hypothetical protein
LQTDHLIDLKEFWVLAVWSMTELTQLKTLEIAHLDLRYAHTRIRRPEALLPLMRSLEKWG